MSNRNTMLSLYLAKVETTEGTDAAPAAASDAIALAEPFDPDYENAFINDNDTQVKGADINPGDPLKPAGKVYSWTKRAWFRGTTGAPTALNKFELDAWLQSMGMAVAYDATGGAEKATYTPASSSLKTITEWVYHDGALRKGVAARADGGLSFDVGGPVVIEHVSSGILSSDADTAIPAAPTFKTTEYPTANDMTTFTVDSFTAGIIRRFNLRWGNAVTRRDGVKATGGVAGYRIGVRKPTFEVVLEEPLKSVKDFTTLRDNRTPIAISWLLGATQYNKLEFSAARAFIRRVQPSNDGGLALLTISGHFASSTPFSLAVK